jgi:hypothetical protein
MRGHLSPQSIVVLAGLGLAAFFIASGADSLRGAPVATAGAFVAPKGLLVQPPSPARGAAVIITRNPFDSAKLLDAPGRASASITCAPPRGVFRVGVSEFSLDRSFVDWLLEQHELLRHTRFVPAGSANSGGLQMLSVHDTVLATLGLEDGDRLERLNGLTLSSPEEALETYARLRTAGHVSAVGVRQGRPLTITFIVR